MRWPAPFGGPSPCCAKYDAKMVEWGRFTQYATCGPVHGPGCKRLYWHDGTKWILQTYEQHDYLKRII